MKTELHELAANWLVDEVEHSIAYDDDRLDALATVETVTDKAYMWIYHFMKDEDEISPELEAAYAIMDTLELEEIVKECLEAGVRSGDYAKIIHKNNTYYISWCDLKEGKIPKITD